MDGPALVPGRGPTPVKTAKSMKFSSRLLFGLSAALFVACLTQDGYYIAGYDTRAWSPAIGLLLVGWMGLGMHVYEWLANPLLVLAWFFAWKARPGRALICSALALLFMAGFLYEKRIVSNENGGTSVITGYGLGYWLWMASAAVMLVGAGMAFFHARQGAAGAPAEPGPTTR